MAVDWHIHVVEVHIDEAALRCFFHNHAGHEFEDFNYRCPQKPTVSMCQHHWDIAKTAAVEIGDKGWLEPWWKGTASEDLKDPITEIVHACDDFTSVTPELVEQIKGCYDLPSTRMYPMANANEYRDRVVAFLNQHMDEKIFMVGW